MQLVYNIENRPMTQIEHLAELITYQESVKRQAEIDNRFFQRRISQAANSAEKREAEEKAAAVQQSIKRCAEVLAFLNELMEEATNAQPTAEQMEA
jgi:hypothetical protein